VDATGSTLTLALLSAHIVQREFICERATGLVLLLRGKSSLPSEDFFCFRRIGITT
jgi:hypothetical protein